MHFAIYFLYRTFLKEMILISCRIQNAENCKILKYHWPLKRIGLINNNNKILNLSIYLFGVYNFSIVLSNPIYKEKMTDLKIYLFKKFPS